MSSWTLINFPRALFKSRLAGFFVFSLLLGCQPDTISPEQQRLQLAQHDATIAMQLARQRLAEDELSAALGWWRHAAALGATEALSHAVQLQQRLEGKLATAKWLDAKLKTDPLLLKQLAAPLLAELGLWSYTLPAELSEPLSGWQSAEGCRLTLQPVVSTLQGERTWQQLQAAWQADPQLSALPVCFKAAIRFDSVSLACSEQSTQRIRCHYQQLKQQVETGDFQQLLLIAGRGFASYNNGIVQLPENANLALLRHEFLHIAGFLDEYALVPMAARAVCQMGRIAPNILVGNSAEIIQRYYQRYGDAGSAWQLTPVDTCNSVGLQAYRPIAALNPLRHNDAPLPAFYYQLLQQQLQRAEHLMPVQYYFAYLARQQAAWQDWQHFMQRAAAFGYPAAIAALAVNADS